MTFSTTLSVNYQCYSKDSLIILIPGQWLAGWLCSLAWSWACHSWWMGKTKGALDGPSVREYRVRGRVRSWGLCWTSGRAAACRCSPLLWLAPEEGGTNGSGGLYDHREDKKREREWGIACVFPRHASSCETMIYAFLRTLGSQNVTFNQAHWEQSKC